MEHDKKKRNEKLRLVSDEFDDVYEELDNQIQRQERDRNFLARTFRLAVAVNNAVVLMRQP